MTRATAAGAHAWIRSYRTRLRVTDIVVVLLAVGLAQLSRFGTDDTSVQAAGVAVGYWDLSALVALIWIALIGASRTRDARVVGAGPAEYRLVVRASALTFGLIAIASLLFKIDIARGYFIVAMPVGLAALIVSRWLWRRWLVKQRAVGRYLTRAIVVGTLRDVNYVVTQIDGQPSAAYQLVGVMIDGEHPRQISSARGPVSVIAGLDGIAAVASRLGVDTVIVAGQPNRGDDFIRTLGWQLEGTATELVLASRLVDIAGPRIHFRPVEGLPLIHVEIPQYGGPRHAMKRTLDITLSGLALLALAPVFAVLALLVRSDSPGPVIFRQERVGRKGVTFTMRKFRSMSVDAEQVLESLRDRNEGAGVLFKMKNDPRVTRVGAVLRRFSLDELPQLWNVFIGDMSLVGPRPPLASEVAGYEDHVHRRLFIKPGLTGMWQVNGRSDLSWDEGVRLDLYYVENWSLTGDLMIMWRTVKVLTNPTGAY
ncbi:sugar transferase [Agreia sp. COWG]|uniref:sugar transferase n=1 Tax=Agreia sp. COWG TaxID=2773266 RepID=UPI001928AB30|nr:sugar transferase [Agreia sp. COWG]CAD5991133.1 Undecaprenyl-phosphate galactose phosphotransferase, WbaP/exopolysaccharide biosynthesis polyprenyl glycosylphosphotransferase [Agreia sp. COWG]